MSMNVGRSVMMRRFIICCNIKRLTEVLNSCDVADEADYLRSLVRHYRQELALLDVDEYGAFSGLWHDLNAERDGSGVVSTEFGFDDIKTDLPMIILDPGPGLKILSVNEALTAGTGTSRGRLLGRPVYDAFPENPKSSESECISHTFNAINQTTRLKAPQILTHQRYDIGNSNGIFKEYYWRMEFQPLLGSNDEVEFIKLIVAKI